MSNGSSIDVNTFRERWAFFPLAQTYRMRFQLQDESAEFKKLTDNFYFKMIRMYPFWRKIRPFIKRYIYFWASEEEKAILQHPFGKELFKIWLENIEGRKSGFRAEILEKILFFKYIFMNLNVAHHPEHKEKYVNFQNSNFGMKLLRPNPEAHIYLAFSFFIRPLKPLIAKYCETALITGDFETLFRRYPPYHFIVSINASPGQRTSVDWRGIDFPPIIYKLPMKYNVPIEFDKVQCRSNNRFVTCPIIYDINEERKRQAEIKWLKNEIDGIFPSPAYAFGTQVDDDGSTVFFGKDGKKEPVPMFGPRRGRFLSLNAELTLLKAIPRMGADSGLTIRFQLYQPITALIEGIDRTKDVSLDEIAYAWKVMDMLPGAYAKAKEKNLIPIINELINKVFENPNCKGPKDDTLVILNEIDRLRNEVSEEAAWRFLIEKLQDGKGIFVLHAICLRLTTNVFEVVFNLWPLITGKDISIDDSGEVHVTERRKEEIEVEEDRVKENDTRKVKKKKKNIVTSIENRKSKREKDGKKTLLPLIEIAKLEMEDLLKKVFSRHLDVSAATKRNRSEPRLAGMIVDYCLKVKSDPDDFRKRLKDHLLEHYDIHYKFLGEYIRNIDRNAQSTYILEQIHKFKLKEEKIKLPNGNVVTRLQFDQERIEEQIDKDVNGIIELIEISRDRLYSPNAAYRLLCFIDPLSVEVQIGDFFYEGSGLKEEDDFIDKYQELQYELAEIWRNHRAEVEKIKIQKTAKKRIIDMDRQAIKVIEQYATEKSESERRIVEVELRKLFSETKRQAIEELKDGNVKEYAVLSLIKAHHEGGIEAVEKVLSTSPNLMRAIDPESYRLMAVSQLKGRLANILENNPEFISRETIAMLLNKDVKDIVASNIYKGMNDTFADILKNLRISPMWGGAGGYRSDQRGLGGQRDESLLLETRSGEFSPDDFSEMAEEFDADMDGGDAAEMEYPDEDLQD